jgi:hypothetical protein
MQGASLWAALHLAAERPDGTKPSVLVSVTQKVGSFAEECLLRLEEWPAERLPLYRDDSYEADPGVQRCLAIAADYFGVNSVEYRLLQRGIAVHHGKMPGLLGRRLKSLMDRGMVRIIVATSTLSEGVNIPVTYLLIPNIYRGNGAPEFRFPHPVPLLKSRREQPGKAKGCVTSGRWVLRQIVRPAERQHSDADPSLVDR